jgi:hypothetical protein
MRLNDWRNFSRSSDGETNREGAAHGVPYHRRPEVTSASPCTYGLAHQFSTGGTVP